jgi:2-hydroxychromene-2-carboxylate isomerase
MKLEPITFYFDYVSPFAFLASRRVEAIAARLGRGVEPVPVLFAGLLNHFGHVGPAEIEPKRRWAFKQALRRAARHGIGLAVPPHHPFNPLLPLRLTHVVPSPQRWQVVHALFAATWEAGRGVEQGGDVRAALAGVGVDTDALLEQAEAPGAKQALRRATDEAAALGVFGVPTCVVDGELYWGDDSLEDIVSDHEAGGARWDERLERWLEIQPSATRTANRRGPSSVG